MSHSASRMAPRSPRFLADQIFKKAIVDGVRRKRPGIVFLTALEAGTLHKPDPEVLSRAKELDLILISYDRRTMPRHFADFLIALPQGEHCPGVFLMTQERFSIGETIQFIVEIFDLSSHEEWRDQINDLPL